jgi:hypothetical protein
MAGASEQRQLLVSSVLPSISSGEKPIIAFVTHSIRMGSENDGRENCWRLVRTMFFQGLQNEARNHPHLRNRLGADFTEKETDRLER